jgi:adenosine deaminase
MRDLVRLPKAELHVHLEGAVRVATLMELADRYGRPLPSSLRDGRYSFVDFPDFLAQWLAVQDCLRGLEDLERIAVEFCQDEARQGVRYAEAHVSLAEHAVVIGEWEACLEAVLSGFDRGRRESGVECAVIVDVVRGIDMALSERATRTAVAFAGRGVVAMGLGGSELFAPEPYADFFDEARRGGLHTVAHAGETGGPESIRAALDALRAERLGHGIRILEDERLAAEVRDRGVPLEVCPTSNVMTGQVGSLQEHPLPALLEKGLTVTLNSDDPAMFGSFLANEYEQARSAFGLSDESLASIALAGVGVSFADATTKAALEREIQLWLDQPPPEGA